jgi:hypothetical protein
MIDIKNLGSMKFQAFGKNKNYFFLFPYVSRLRLCLIHGSGHLTITSHLNLLNIKKTMTYDRSWLVTGTIMWWG